MNNNKEFTNKLYRNALIGERLSKLDKYERSKVVNELLKGSSLRELEQETGIPKSTLQDWSSLRQSNTGANIHVSFSSMIRKLGALKISDLETDDDWDKIEEINKITYRLLETKKFKLKDDKE